MKDTAEFTAADSATVATILRVMYEEMSMDLLIVNRNDRSLFRGQGNIFAVNLSSITETERTDPKSEEVDAYSDDDNNVYCIVNSAINLMNEATSQQEKRNATLRYLHCVFLLRLHKSF